VIASDLSMSRAIPATMAEMNVVQRALVQSQNYAANGEATEPALRAALLKDPQMLAVSNFLHDAQGFSGLDQIWLVNTNGTCVASSNSVNNPLAAESSFVGVDMRTRSYLTNALLGAFSEAYGVGRSSGEPGIFIAAPVYADGLLVGAVVAKVGIARLRHWAARSPPWPPRRRPAGRRRTPAPSSPMNTASSSWRTTARSKATHCRTRPSRR
jgi:C4-dicarboxylate-specific signal transduction histidine kinase